MVTGGARRVGRAIVEKLAREGFAVALTYHHSASDADAIRAQLGDERICLIQADLTEPESAVEQIRRNFEQFTDRLDLLVNNASIYEPGDEKLRQMHAIHVEAPLRLCRGFEPLLRVARGHVVNMTDLLAERPWPKYSAYCSTKAALSNLTLTLARELAPEVTVNAIAPGVVEWPADFPQSERDKYLQRVPLQRAGTPQDVANLVHFLATGGSYITGQIIRLDGGRSIV